MSKPSNQNVSYDAHEAELNLVGLPLDTQAVVNASKARDAVEAAAHEARLAQSAADLAEIQRLQVLLSQVIEQTEDPAARLDTDKRLEKRVEQLKTMLANKRKEVKEKRNRKGGPFIARRNTSQILKAIADMRGSQTPVTVTIPAKYNKANGLELVRADIAAKDARVTAIYDARLTQDEAFARFKRAVLRTSEKAASIPFGEFSRVRKMEGGRMTLQDVEIPPEFFNKAVEAFTLATGEERIQKMYEGFELEPDVEILSLPARKRELAAIETEIAALERIEGALLRRAALAGEPIVIRPTMSIQTLLGVHSDAKPKPFKYREGPAGTPASAFVEAVN